MLLLFFFLAKEEEKNITTFPNQMALFIIRVEFAQLPWRRLYLWSCERSSSMLDGNYLTAQMEKKEKNSRKRESK